MDRPTTHRWLPFYLIIFSLLNVELGSKGLAILFPGQFPTDQFLMSELNRLLLNNPSAVWEIDYGRAWILGISFVVNGVVLIGLLVRKRWALFVHLVTLVFVLFKVFVSPAWIGFAALLYVVPNGIYLWKRQYLFDDGKGPYKTLFGKRFRVLDPHVISEPSITGAIIATVLVFIIGFFVVNGGQEAKLSREKSEQSVEPYQQPKAAIESPYSKFVQDFTQSLRQKAERGDAEAQLALGGAYSSGQGVPQDYKEAVKWCRLSAEQGLVEAQLALGRAYYLGEGVPQDYKEAVKWYRLAAEQRHADAQYRLGLYYEAGRGVPQDYKEAVKWYRLSAEQGHADAQYMLGITYAKGQGVPQDYKEAVKWFRLAAEQGLTEAQHYLGISYAFGQEGFPQDYKEAVKWFRLAAEQGLTEAQYNLGVSYAKGQGVPQDYVQAYAWVNIAAAQGYEGAAETRTKIMRTMTPSQIEEGQRVSREYAEKVIKK